MFDFCTIVDGQNGLSVTVNNRRRNDLSSLDTGRNRCCLLSCRLLRVGIEASCRLASFIECWAAGRRASLCGFASRRGHTELEVLASSQLVATQAALQISLEHNARVARSIITSFFITNKTDLST